MYMSRQLDDQDDPLEAEWYSEDAHIHYQNHKIIQLYVKNNIFEYFQYTLYGSVEVWSWRRIENIVWELKC